MIPKISCQQCGNEILPDDQFCSNCGAKIEWRHSAPSQVSGGPPPPVPGVGQACPLCGQQNSPEASSCISCGAALAASAPASSQASKHPARKEVSSSQHQPLRLLQSWKFPAGIAVALILVLVIMRFTQKSDLPAAMPPNMQAFSQEAESLQKAVEENPKNDQALLRLADLYHDSRQFARAIIMYDRYLEINPSNPDARVDLGISYFEMGLMDSTNREQYFTTAKDEMKKALTYAPKHQLAYYNLGMVSLHSAGIEEANEWFGKCAAIDSTSEVGKRAQQLVHQHSFTNPS